MPEQQKKQEAYARYQNYTNKTLWQLIEGGELDPIEQEVVMMILDGRKK